MGWVSSGGEPEEYNLGPHPSLEPKLESFLGGHHHHKTWKGVMTFHWSPSGKIARCGWSGEHTMLTCWSGQRN